MRSLLFCIVAGWCCLQPVQARISRCISPEEVDARATLVCNGMVLSVEPVGAPQIFSYSSIYPDSQRECMMAARIKVLHVFKGVCPDVITLHYRVSAPIGGICNGPMHLNLVQGERCRFFLKPGPESYVNVLQDQVDDCFAVEPLWAGEADDSPYLTKTEAIQLARNFLQSKRLDAGINWKSPHVQCLPLGREGAIWTIILFGIGGDFGNSPTIRIHGDRTVHLDEKS